ncbi:Aste57867_790 [Aphanomyces stellatus]|uniref:Aste57867_790 protein n=1 Tax=Aphanomyces stellatus TaxID=120398 RepID=A0A485K7M1_9STRA|nr:hypothetical protein As57867_000789 [Aphanomyces stellatus]VFT78014.1 Aste57867_790 [Aphanomyces stellatus]
MQFKYLAVVAAVTFAQDETTEAPVTITPTVKVQRPGVCNAGGKDCTAYGPDYVCVAVQSNLPNLANLAQCVNSKTNAVCVGGTPGACPTFNNWPTNFARVQPVCAFVTVKDCNKATNAAGAVVAARELQATNSSNSSKKAEIQCYQANYQLQNGSTAKINGIYKCVDKDVYRQSAYGFDLTDKQMKNCAGNVTNGFTAGLCNQHGTCGPTGQFSAEYGCMCNKGYSTNDNCNAPVSDVCDAFGACGALGACDPTSGKCKCQAGVTGPQCNKCDPTAGNGTCSNHGSCGLDGTCVCQATYGGAQCESKSATDAPTKAPRSNTTAVPVATAASSAFAVGASAFAVAVAAIFA